MNNYKDTDKIIKNLKVICDNCWTPYRIGGCPKHCGVNEALNIINSISNTDVIPVKHGKWIRDGYDDYYWVCSCCRQRRYEYYEKPIAKFCENCGADMRKDGEQHGQTE